TRDLIFVLPGEETSVGELDRADVLVLRLDAADLRARGVIGAFHLDAAARQLGADHFDHRRLRRNRARIVEREGDLTAGPLAAGLHARPAAPDDPDVLAELAEHLVVAAAEALAGRRQDDDRDHAPQDPEHRQEAAQLVRAKILEGLGECFSHEGRTTLSPAFRPSRI